MKKRTAVIVITTLSVALAAAVVIAANNVKKISDTELDIAAKYRHAFSEIVTGVSELDSALQKSVLVTSPSMAGTVCTEVYAKAQTTSMALGVLPFSATELEKTVGFINTVGDYAFSLSQKAGRGEEFSQEDKDALKSLSETMRSVALKFKELDNEIGSEMIDICQYERTLREYDESEGEVIPQTLADSMSSYEQEFPEMPSLIYDGPFSEHLKDGSSRFLEGREEIDEADGRRAAAEFLGMRPEQVYPTGEQAGDLPAYCYATEINGSRYSVCVTKAGGVVVNVLGSRHVANRTLSAKEALDAAKKMLERWGYTGMKDSYYVIHNNILTANFAYQQGGVLCYPDLIKVSIAMDNGTLQGFEAMGYVSSHYERELPEAQVSMDRAREKVPGDCAISTEQLVIIPTPGKYESMCYEFCCEDEGGRKYIIYVNAASGDQEKILLLLEDENGTLTI